MSVTNPSNEESYECAHCGGDRHASTSVAGSFCSIECYRSHRASKRADELLELIEHDHRFCRSCFAQLKEVHKPAGKSVVVGPSLHDGDWGNASDVLVGFQRRTDAAEIGERSLDVDDDRGDEERPIVEDGVATGTICRCGATDHRDHGDEVRESVAPARLGKQLVEAIETLGLEDKHEVDVLGPAIRAAVESGDSPREAIEEAVILE